MKNFDSVVTVFEAVVSRFPNACAVRCEGKSWTYRDLNASANRLAARLRQLGTKRDSLVGIHLDRSYELIVAILAILKADGAYLPLDLACPEDRLKFMVDDSSVKVVLTDVARAPRFGAFGGTLIRLDEEEAALAKESAENAPSTAGEENIAYVIYTSGSTGTPKGVLVTHENVARLFTATEAWFRFGPADVWTMFHSCAFDFSVWEVFGALLYGGTLVMVPYETSRTPDAFFELLTREKVTVLNQTPSAFRQLVQAALRTSAAETSLRFVIFGGEALEFQSLLPWFERFGDKQPQCVNMYGITETTVHVTYRPISRQDVEARSGSNIGVAIPDLQIYLVNEGGKRVGSMEPGEILVGGRGVAAGYLNRPDLTKQRFIANEFEPEKSARLYRTGDLARWLANGDLEYLGRIDHQVKIRGFRIELDEINATLARYPAVRESAVIARAGEDGEPRLLAYLIVDPKASPTVEALRAHLIATLPAYMVPTAYVFMESFPLTINGKLDRDQLPAPGTNRPNLAATFTAPQDDLEESIAKVWREILQVDEVGVNDNYFDLGGDSLSAMKMMAGVEQVINRPAPMRALLEGGTIASLAKALREGGPVTPPPLMICVQTGGDATPFFFAHGDYLAGGFYCQRMAQLLGAEQPFYSLAPPGTFGGELPETFEEIAARYIELIRSRQPTGPYRLGGFCNGAIAIYEVAQQLARAGEKVESLILLDPPDLYFFLLRQRVNRIGKFFGLPDRQCRAAYQRITEGVEIWKDYGTLRLARAFVVRIYQWVLKNIRQLFRTPPGSTMPDLNFHYFEVMAQYQPVPLALDLNPVWIILRKGENHRHPQQIRFWKEFIKHPRFERVEGTHLELKTSMTEIAKVVKQGLPS
jgi:amino acid adenylation domain-containing protein